MVKNVIHRIAPSEVLEHIRRLILKGNMRPGERLPAERALALQLGVGRPAVREAIKALQILDVLDSRHGDGTFIKSLASLSGGWPSKVELTDQDFDLIELLEVRRMFEPNAASLAAARRDQKQLKLIEQELVAQERDPDDKNLLVRHDFLFHEQIMRAAGNHVLESVAGQLAPLLLKSRKMTSRTTPDIRKVIQQHRMIFEAIRIRDPDLAEQAMWEHLQTAGLDLIAYNRHRIRAKSKASSVEVSGS
jgi:GntR family transcriptional regulator, transcriptional repressor for pyruvate dehydrogenase complex